MTYQIKSTHPLGELIHQVKDGEGLVSVYQRKKHRFLTFGNAVEQSCINLNAPHQLEHIYTQAMMLSLLFCADIRNGLLLGLGGGSLARALQHARPRIKIHAVEYRQTVIDAAQRFFELQTSQYLQLHCAEATAFIRSDTHHYDLIFADLYLADGAHNAQKDQSFFADCRQRLSKNGLLLTNLWCSEFQDSQIAQKALKSAFGENVLYLHVQGGNVIAFAFNHELPNLKRNGFYDNAQELGNKLGIPLQRLARNFWRQNSEPLQIGRFAQKYSVS